MYNDLCKSLDRGLTTQASLLLLVYIWKAFNRVWHLGLIHTIEASGIRRALLRSFKDDLKHRRQAVVIKGQKLDYGKTSAGVPQGLVLGLLLFLIYTDGVAHLVKRRTRIQRTKVRIPSRAQDKFVTFSESKMLC